MNCPKCGLLIGHGTMGTVTPLCQCSWNQKVLVGSTSKGREVAELLQQLAEYKQRAEAAEAKLRESEMQKPQAFALIVDGAFCSAHRHKYDAEHEGMEIGARFDVIPLYAKPFPKQEDK